MFVVLAGGVGGARFAAGLAQVVDPERLTVIVNTADDFEHLGLAISPDLDTVMYTLAGLENMQAGWGRRDETWRFMETLSALGGETWFQLGDRDLAVHVERTRRLVAGASLEQVTGEFARSLGVASAIVPMSNDRVRTILSSDEGELEFQHYFVRRRCVPQVHAIKFVGAGCAKAAPGVLAALADPRLQAIVIGPSNPYVSIAPILAIGGIRRALERRAVPLVAVSPIIGGMAVKGPAAKMMRELGAKASAMGIASHYRGLIDGLVIDNVDRDLADAIARLGVSVHVADTVMQDAAMRRELAGETIAFAARLGAVGRGVVV